MSLELIYKPYNLELKNPFTISNFSRTYTPIVLTQINFQNFVGYGEASMPPYLGESHETALQFLSKLDLSTFKDPINEKEEILKYVDHIAPGNTAAKASIDIALHDLIGKLLDKPCWRMFNVDTSKMPCSSYTIGIDKPDVVIKKVKDAAEFKILKVKLGSDDDKLLINTIRSITDKDLYVDANQGWKNKEEALEMIYWLKEQNCKLIEQPLPKQLLEDAAWLTQHSPLPIVADEAFQRLSDLEKIKDAYTGINIKLMKCTGLQEANKIINRARELNLKILLGCMSETSCAINAAAQLAPLCDWADLDGPFLVSNNPYKTPEIENGKIKLSELPGIGLVI
jgi:L-alanine-DL-glutamate epimerase-like enolase superfamily enzyme